MRFREVERLVKQLLSTGSGGGGTVVPDLSAIHSPDPVPFAAAVPEYDSGTGFIGNASYVDVRAISDVFFPALEADKGYFLEFQWGADTSEDGVRIGLDTYPEQTNNMNLEEHVGPTPVAGGVFTNIYMPPGYTVIIEALGPSGRFSPMNVFEAIAQAA